MEIRGVEEAGEIATTLREVKSPEPAVSHVQQHERHDGEEEANMAL